MHIAGQAHSSHCQKLAEVVEAFMLGTFTLHVLCVLLGHHYPRGLPWAQLNR